MLGTTKLSGVRAAGGILDRIVQAKAKRLEETKRRAAIERLATSANGLASSRLPNSFTQALSRSNRINIIAEIKQRSPSKGIICKDFDPVRIAESYANAGAAALSILTEEDFFGGSLDHLKAIREVVTLPLLRKDFIFDEYQIYESVLAGANAVLLIVAILEDDLMASLINLTRKLGLAALVEVHSVEEMKRANRAGASLIGINNRDLTNFSVDINTSVELARLAPDRAIMVSESGINTGADIRNLKPAGFNSFLVGEHLMRATEPGEALKQLTEEAEL
ncbi:MAG TPA: indole-3-glycerol phosphate synthase TrpC [Blastocatellia bacterium]